jgi:hypothetical protein
VTGLLKDRGGTDVGKYSEDEVQVFFNVDRIVRLMMKSSVVRSCVVLLMMERLWFVEAVGCENGGIRIKIFHLIKILAPKYFKRRIVFACNLVWASAHCHHAAKLQHH